MHCTLLTQTSFYVCHQSNRNVLFLRNFLDIVHRPLTCREVIFDPADPKYVSVSAYGSRVKNVVLERRNRWDHSLVYASGRCPVMGGVR